MSKYQVIVGNVGTVYDGDDYAEARKEYSVQVGWSMLSSGRAANEPVTLMADGDVAMEHIPRHTSGEPGLIRLVICVDLRTDDLTEAYRMTRQELNKTTLAWETSDEFYPDLDSDDPGDPAELQAAIEKYWRSES